jgi:hypothetical protein
VNRYSKLRNELRRKYGGRGYTLCEVEITPPCDTNALAVHRCGTPIRPLLWITPTGRYTARRTPSGRPLELTRHCEVCHKEFAEEERYGTSLDALSFVSEVVSCSGG